MSNEKSIVEAQSDIVLPFQVGDTAVRGRVVRLGGVIDEILKAHQFPHGASALLGEAACLVSMMGASLKFDGKLIFQAQGDGPVSMLVADYSADGALRGTAKIKEEASALKSVQDASDAGALLGKGHMVLTIDQGADMDRYQGVTPIVGVTLADVAVGYFDQSEQIPTVVKLAVGKVSSPGEPERWRAGGVMAQFVPGEGGSRERGEEIRMSTDEIEIWERAAAFISTTQDDELIDPAISAETLLYRLFHEDGVRVFEPQKIRADCSCSSDKIAAVLSRYTEDDLQDMVENGQITVTCEFCRKDYRFTPQGELAGA